MSGETPTREVDADPRSREQQSYKMYRVEMPCHVVAHDEVQAEQRWQHFLDWLGHLGSS